MSTRTIHLAALAAAAATAAACSALQLTGTGTMNVTGPPPGSAAASSPAAAPPSCAAKPAGTDGMVSIPAADFTAGSTSVENANNPHQVHVNAFAMDINEVTVAAYDACVCAGACTAPPAAYGSSTCNWSDYNANFKSGPSARGDNPVNCVSFTQAAAYCDWAGRRLPTEDEWERAARGTDGRNYPWGNTPPTTSQACWSRGTTCPVGSFPGDSSPFGVHDMAANVAEWTSTGDTHDSDGKADPAARVFRGGSWSSYDNPQFAANGMSGLESASRFAAPPAQATAFNGFRCAK